jgi:hypothetical protein
MTILRSFSSSLGLLTLAAVGLTACEPKLDAVPAASAGALNVSRYVAFGDDYSAGVANGGLTATRQEYSFPNLLARQFALVGGGAFVQPLFGANESTGGLTILGFNTRNQALLGPVDATSLDSEIINPGTACATTRYRFPAWAGVATGATLNNFSVPGLRLADLESPGLGDDANLHTATSIPPYNGALERILADGADGQSYTTLAKQTQPTFLTVSIGLNDFIPFIRTGGTCGPLPTAATLSAQAGRYVDSLVATTGAARGVIISAPSLANLPLTRTRVSDVNSQLGRSTAAPVFVRNASGTAVVAAAGDVVLLPMVGRVGRLETATGVATDSAFGLTRSNPLRDEDVIAELDVTSINGRITGRNGINDLLSKRAALSGGRFVFVDINGLFLGLANGSYIDGVNYSGDVITGGIFSLDGYTLSPR